MDYLTTRRSLSPIWRGFTPGFVNYKKGCTRLAAASDKVYQLLAHGWWFSPGTPASSTTKTGRWNIAESGIKHQKSNQSNHIQIIYCISQNFKWIHRHSNFRMLLIIFFLAKMIFFYQLWIWINNYNNERSVLKIHLK